VSDEQIPEHMIPAIEKGVYEAFESGAQMGYPVVDVEAVLTGGSYREAGSTELAYTVSTSMAIRDAFLAGEPSLLEPVMNVEIFVPDQFMGDVISDANARGGKIESIDPEGNIQKVKAQVVLSKMFGYSTDLRSASQGRATFTMQFSHFDKP